MTCGKFIKKKKNTQQHSVAHLNLDYVNLVDVMILGWYFDDTLNIPFFFFSFFQARPTVSFNTFVIHVTGNLKKIQPEQNFNSAKDLGSRWAH